MSVSDRIVLRGIAPYLPEGAEVLVVEKVTTDALGEVRKAQAVLTRDDLFIVTRIRLKSVLTQVPRRHPIGGGAQAGYRGNRVRGLRPRPPPRDRARAPRRGDRRGLVAQLSV